MDADTYAKSKLSLAKETRELIALGKSIREKQGEVDEKGKGFIKRAQLRRTSNKALKGELRGAVEEREERVD